MFQGWKENHDDVLVRQSCLPIQASESALKEWCDLIPVAIREFHERYHMLKLDSVKDAFGHFLSEEP